MSENKPPREPAEGRSSGDRDDRSARGASGEPSTGRGQDSTRRARPAGDRRDDGDKRRNRDDRRPERGAGAGDNRRPDDRRPDDRRPERRASGGDKPWGRDERPSDDRRGGGRDKGWGGDSRRSEGRRTDERRGDGRGDRGVRGSRPERSAGAFDNSERRGGSRLAPKSPRLPEPRINEGVTGKELDRSVHQQLRTLSKENAEGVAQHLVMAAALLEAEDFDGAEAHAETAVRRAGRVPAAREALGLVAYRKGEWARALSEFRTARRLSGSSHMLPLMVDCERGLGRPERALDLATSPEARGLSLEDRIELAIVISGIRRDLGQPDAALLALQIPQLRSSARKPWSPRLAYAYADALLEAGDEAGAREWFARAADFDDDLETDAAERLAEIDGIVMTDLLEGEPDEGGSAEDLQVDRGTRGQGRSADATAGDPARGEDGQRG